MYGTASRFQLAAAPTDNVDSSERKAMVAASRPHPRLWKQAINDQMVSWNAHEQTKLRTQATENGPTSISSCHRGEPIINPLSAD